VLGAVAQEASRSGEPLPADGQLDLGRLLHVAKPLAIYVGRPDEKLFAIQHEPNGHFVGFAGLASIVGQFGGVLASYAL